jgi:hypothetical protein
MYPFVDLSSGGFFAGFIAAADHALALGEGMRIMPGHGPVGTRADLRAYRDMLVTVRDRVKPLVQAGKTPAEVVAARRPPPTWTRSGGRAS